MLDKSTSVLVSVSHVIKSTFVITVFLYTCIVLLLSANAMQQLLLSFSFNDGKL